MKRRKKMIKNHKIIPNLLVLFTLLVLNACGGGEPNLNNPESLIGTYSGSNVIAGQRFDFTLIIENTSSCEIRSAIPGASWSAESERYSMRIDKENNVINLGGGEKLVPSGNGFKIYDDWLLVCTVSK
jgi:hypothetical protein